MLKIEDLISEDFSSYPKETQIYLEQFNSKLKEEIKKVLIDNIIEGILKELNKGIDDFKAVLINILENGHKGYNNMSTRALVNTYLEVKGEENFIKIIEKVSSEL